MSFQVNWGSSTRQDHLTFMNGAQPSRPRDPSHPRKPTAAPANSALPLSGAAHVSYAIGAPATSPQRLAASASHPVPGPSARAVSRSATEQLEFSSESAAEHHARLKQRNEPRITSVQPPKVLDTTINIATAFHQAASDKMAGPSSSSSRPAHRHPSEDRRGLSRPPEPGSRNREARSHASITEDDESNASRSFQRGKSPMEALGAAAVATVRGIAPIMNSLAPMVSAVYLKEPSASQTSKPSSRTGPRIAANDTSATLNVAGDSYDYAQEEDIVRGFDAVTSQSTLLTNGSFSQRRKSASQRKMNEDNRAYRPSPDNSGTEEESDGGTRRKRKSGPNLRLTGLPTVGAPSKRRTKKKKDSVGEDRENSQISQEGSSLQRARSSSMNRLSRQPSTQPPTHHDQEDQLLNSHNEPPSLNDDDDYSDIQEISGPPQPSGAIIATSEEESYEDDGKDGTLHASHIGARVGAAVHFAGTGVGAMLLLLVRTAISVYQVLIARPWSIGMDAMHNSKKLLKRVEQSHLFALGALIVAIFLVTQRPFFSQSPPDHLRPTRPWGISFPFNTKRPPLYPPPDLPPSSLQELVDRLTHLESAFSNLEVKHHHTLHEHAQAIRTAENESRAREALAARLSIAETKLEKETRRAMLAEEQYGSSAQRNIDGVQNAVQSLHAEVKSVYNSLAHFPSATPSVDVKTQDRLRYLESQFKDVSAEVKSLARQREKVSIVSPNGQDISSMVSNYLFKDTLARPDFALYYSGGRAIPRFTSKSPTVTKRGQWLFRTQQIVGRPPVVALTPDISIGNCWAFPGAQGQIGIMLPIVIHLTHVTIDHPPKEILLDTTTAPRQFSVWVLIEEQYNHAKADAWEKDTEVQRPQVDAEPPSKPFGSSRTLHFGTFEYDVHSDNHIQTFEIPQHMQALGLDVKAFIVQFHSNWGSSRSSCVYRIRAHGSQATPPE